jgi:hypothetical protein
MRPPVGGVKMGLVRFVAVGGSVGPERRGRGKVGEAGADRDLPGLEAEQHSGANEVLVLLSELALQEEGHDNLNASQLKAESPILRKIELACTYHFLDRRPDALKSSLCEQKDGVQ